MSAPRKVKLRECRFLLQTDLFNGLADVVVIAEPLDPAAQSSLQKHQSRMVTQDPDGALWWLDRRVMVASVSPRGTLTLHNEEDSARTLRIRRDNTPVRELTIPPHAEVAIQDLPQGILRVTSATDPAVEGWIYGTPWPSSVSGGSDS